MIWNFCIKRPVLTVVAFLVLAIFGVYGYFAMPLREYPDVEFPIVSVNVVLMGAEPEVIETEIIEPLEEEINTVEGLKTLTSTAREQVGTITAEFELWRDIDIAAQDVRDRVNRARRDLPDDIEEPIITKLDPDQYAIMWIALTGDERWGEVQLTTYADEVLKERLENIKGVGRVQIGGERKYAVRVTLDPERLAAHHLTVNDVVNTIRANNVDIPSGRIESSEREFLVKTQGQFSSAAPINDLIITYRKGAPVRIGDVGKAEDGVENDRQVARFTGQTSVGLGIVKQSNANTVALAEEVSERIERLSEKFPAGLNYYIASDDSEFIEEGINDLLVTIGFTSVLVMVVVFVFLRSWRGTIITMFAIPTSLLGGVMFMYVLGFSVNFLTMLSLILAIGIVVDDAIVVLENSYRYMEEGQESKPAARVGTTEVAFPAIANTLSLSAVFVPVAFTAGLIGRFFYEFGLTVASTVIVSTITALTLSPMLCSRLLKLPPKHGKLFSFSESVFGRIEAGYKWILGRAFRHRVLTVLLSVGIFVLGILFFKNLSKEFAPTADREQFMIAFETPEGATLSATSEYELSIERVLMEQEGVRRFFAAIGLSQGGGPGKVNEGMMFVGLSPREQRDIHQTEIMQELRRKLSRIPGGRAFVMKEGGPGGMGGAPIQLVLQHTDLERLAEGQQQVMDWMEEQDLFIGVNSNLKMNKPQANVTVNRDKSSELGISVSDIANAMRYLLGEPDIAEIERGNERYEIITQVTDKGEMVPRDIGRIYVRSGAGDLISLDNVVNVTEAIGPSEIHHFNRMRSAIVSASMPPGVAMGDALAAIEEYIAEEMPGDFQYAFTGEAESMQESFRNLTVTVIFSIVFIYLVLAAQFESFVHPFTILLSLPLALVGAGGALYFFDMPFGIVAFIGFIMLLGMVTKNAILLVDYTLVLMGRGKGFVEAAQSAAQRRFRPVLMTTISTVVGITPIALGFGAGGEARAPMGIAVFWGMLLASMLTLVVIPVVFTLVQQLQEKIVGVFTENKE